MPRYKRFRNVSLKLSSLNKSSYEWSSKAIFNAFFALKSSEIYRHSPERTKPALMKAGYLTGAISSSKRPPTDGQFLRPTKPMWLTLESVLISPRCLVIYLFSSALSVSPPCTVTSCVVSSALILSRAPSIEQTQKSVNKTKRLHYSKPAHVSSCCPPSTQHPHISTEHMVCSGIQTGFPSLPCKEVPAGLNSSEASRSSLQHLVGKSLERQLVWPLFLPSSFRLPGMCM